MTSSSSRAPATALALLCLAAGLGGCSGGDFGRARANVRNDDMHRWIGVEATGSIGQPASQFQLTDNERQLRDLAYPLIEPPNARPAKRTVIGNYEPLPSPWRENVAFDRSAYGKLLLDEPRRSHASRYGQLMDDVRNDIARFDSLRPVANRVISLDHKRYASLKYISELSATERADAIARMEENALIVQWVQQCMQQRISSYRWALERLVIHAPDGAAADADRLIGQLEAHVSAAAIATSPVPGRALRTRG